jgi:hypothetical protein
MLNIDLSTLIANGISPKYDGMYIYGERPEQSWQLATGHYQSYINPIITFPRPDSETTTNARHRVNYPGQTYRIPIAVHGGAYPFKYEFVGSVPTGMTIGSTLTLTNGRLVATSEYGVITWPSSVVGTYSITVKITDQNGLTSTVTWQLVVDTTDWIFLNPSAGSNGNGTLGSPYNTLASLASQSTKKLLVMSGTVDLEQKTVGLQSMPKPWLPYNGASVTLLQALSPFYGNQYNDGWFSGFTWSLTSPRSNVNQFMMFDESSRMMFFENTIDLGKFNNTTSETSGTNSSFVMWTGGNPTIAQYNTIKNNIFKNIADRDLCLVYENHYMVIEGNGVQNYGSGVHGWDNGFYLKMSVDNSTVRGNYSIANANTASLLRVDAYAGKFPMDYIDVSYNTYRYSGIDEGAIGFCHEYINFGTHRYIYRNTFISTNSGAAPIFLRGMGAGDLVTLSNNVLVTAGSNLAGLNFTEYQGTLANTGAVSGNTAANIVDSDNYLTGSSASFLGRKGAEIL